MKKETAHTKSRNDLLGVGIYTPNEAARYARITTSMMKRWVHGSHTAKQVVHAELKDDPDRFVTFADFIQSAQIRKLRNQHPQPSLQKIRQAHDEAVKRYKVPFPFAMSHTAYYDGKAIWISLPWREADRNDSSEWPLTQVTGKGKGQSMFKEVADIYEGKINYDLSHRANEFILFESKFGAITMNPAKRFGEPLLPSGYSLNTIVDAYRDLADIRRVMDSFEVTRDEVNFALLCDDHLNYRATAA